MNRKNYKYALMIIALFLAFSSCKKFLDLTPISSATTDNAYETADDIEAGLNGAYGAFIATNYYQWEIFAHTDVRADNAYCGGSNDVDYYQLDMNNIPNTNGSVERAWTELYASIAKANNVLYYLPDITDESLTDERRAQITGEACFLRAFHYFQLVSLFGGLPLERESVSSDASVIDLPRATETETYDFIDSNLLVAVANLPETFGADNIDKVRATKGSAFALLAKIWAQRSDRDYSKVDAYCDSVINLGKYALLSDFDNLFDGSNNYNEESIMEISYLASTDEANWGTEMLYPTRSDDGTIESPWQRYCVPSHTLVNAYTTEGDAVRLKTSVSFEPADWSDDFWNPCGNTTDSLIPFAYKQRHPNSWSGGDHVYLLRYADVLLLKAEALANLGELSDALTYLNMIRSRVGLADVSTTSQSELLTKILKERQLEFAFEWQRWNDLNRFGVTVTTMNNLGETTYVCNDDETLSTGTSIDYDFDDNSTLLPIPLTELQANPNLTQNPGY
ncbi:MAG: RagB/SusD family nutrient uptake outer membrane protein [Chitinophagaceae bacterium]